jgi:hypothetical protein
MAAADQDARAYSGYGAAMVPHCDLSHRPGAVTNLSTITTGTITAMILHITWENWHTVRGGPAHKH